MRSVLFHSRSRWWSFEYASFMFITRSTICSILLSFIVTWQGRLYIMVICSFIIRCFIIWISWCTPFRIMTWWVTGAVAWKKHSSGAHHHCRWCRKPMMLRCGMSTITSMNVTCCWRAISWKHQHGDIFSLMCRRTYTYVYML